MRIWVAITVGLVMISVVANAQPYRTYDVHFRKQFIAPRGQRFSGIRLKIACAHILNVNAIPDDWSISTVRAISAVEEFSADAGHGASWLDDLKPLDGIMTVTVAEPADVSCFRIYGTLTTEGDDSKHEMPIHFSDFRLETRH